MAYIKVYLHMVWSTKNRYPFLDTPELRSLMWKHIKEHSKKRDIQVDLISGTSDHCHCLLSLGVEQTIGRVVQMLKGESSYWINRQQLIPRKFEWQDEYFAVSVSESMVETVREYIQTQESRHTKKTFQQEYEEFMTKYGFSAVRERANGIYPVFDDSENGINPVSTTNDINYIS